MPPYLHAQIDPDTLKAIRDTFDYILALGAVGIGLFVLVLGVMVVYLTTRRSKSDNQILSQLITQVGTPLQEIATSLKTVREATLEQVQIMTDHKAVTEESRGKLDTLIEKQEGVDGSLTNLRESVETLAKTVVDVKDSLNNLIERFENGDKDQAISGLQNEVQEAVKELQDVKARIEALYTPKTEKEGVQEKEAGVQEAPAPDTGEIIPEAAENAPKGPSEAKSISEGDHDANATA